MFSEKERKFIEKNRELIDSCDFYKIYNRYEDEVDYNRGGALRFVLIAIWAYSGFSTFHIGYQDGGNGTALVRLYTDKLPFTITSSFSQHGIAKKITDDYCNKLVKYRLSNDLDLPDQYLSDLEKTTFRVEDES